jgi:multicomponent K+:H+ antiporter subunit G
VLHEIVIAAFVVVTTPVTYMLLVRAAIERDAAGREKGPGKPPPTRDVAAREN